MPKQLFDTTAQCLLVVSFWCALLAPTIAAEFFPLGTLPGDSTSSARGVSDDGEVVAGWSGRPSTAARWTRETGWVGVGVLEGFEAWSGVGAGAAWITDGISGDGTTVVGYANNGSPPPNQEFQAFIHTVSDGIQEIPDIGFATDASFDGQIVVGLSGSELGNRAYRWTAEDGPTLLPSVHEGDVSIAFSITPDGGKIAGFRAYFNDEGRQEAEAIIWTTEGMTETGVEVSTNATLDLSGDGSTLVGGHQPVKPGDVQAFQWTEADGVSGLGWLPGSMGERGLRYSEATSANQDGSLIVGYSGLGTQVGEENLRKAFVWTQESGMEDMQQVLMDRYGLADQLDGWHLAQPSSLSPDGRFISGTGFNPNGDVEGWLIRLDAPVPEPSSFTLAWLSLIGLISLIRSGRLK